MKSVMSTFVFGMIKKVRFGKKRERTSVLCTTDPKIEKKNKIIFT